MMIHARENSSNPKGGIPVDQDIEIRRKEMERSQQDWERVRQSGYELASRQVDGLPILSAEEMAELIRQEKEHIYEQWVREQGIEET